MRQVEAAADRGEPDARLAIDVYIHRLAGGIAAMSAATEGVDVLAFTGGVGEHSADCWPGSDSPGHRSGDLAAARPAGPPSGAGAGAPASSGRLAEIHASMRSHQS
jgi:hypothetical protein